MALLPLALWPAGGFERSEVVSDEATLDASRTSFGAWLSGHKRDAKARGTGGGACTALEGGAGRVPAVACMQRNAFDLSPPRPRTLPLQGARDPAPHPRPGGHPRAVWRVAVRAAVRAGAAVRCSHRPLRPGAQQSLPCCTATPALCRPSASSAPNPLPSPTPQTAGQPVTSSCEEFLERAGGPKCGPGGGGITCGDRLATVVLYLRSPSRGGSTVFPHAPKLVQPGGPAPLQAQPREGSADGAQHAGEGAPSRSTLQQQHGSGVLTGGAEVPSYCEEGADALQVSPPPGTAVLFW